MSERGWIGPADWLSLIALASGGDGSSAGQLSTVELPTIFRELGREVIKIHQLPEFRRFMRIPLPRNLSDSASHKTFHLTLGEEEVA